jgi:hypothetical protein
MLINFEERLPKHVFKLVSNLNGMLVIDAARNEFIAINNVGSVQYSIPFKDSEEEEFFALNAVLKEEDIRVIQSLILNDTKTSAAFCEYKAEPKENNRELLHDEAPNYRYYFSNAVGQCHSVQAHISDYAPGYLPALRGMEDSHIQKFAGLHDGSYEDYSGGKHTTCAIHVKQLKEALKHYEDGDVITFTTNSTLVKPSYLTMEKLTSVVTSQKVKGGKVLKQEDAEVDCPQKRKKAVLFGYKVPINKSRSIRFFSNLGLKSYKSKLEGSDYGN